MSLRAHSKLVGGFVELAAFEEHAPEVVVGGTPLEVVRERAA
jgi:hypothetical protein